MLDSLSISILWVMLAFLAGFGLGIAYGMWIAKLP